MSHKHELRDSSESPVDVLLADLTGLVKQGWRDVARTHLPALDRRCGTCGDRSPCRAYREATRSGSRPVEPVQR
jgi:hypothetical protein